MAGKRPAAEYITKEHGSTVTANAFDDKPKMASASQMAGRKTATPRGRLNRAGTPQRRFAPSANSQPNPFANTPQNTFGTVGSGITFGAGQQDSASQSQSSGFNFSANSTGNNPFANHVFPTTNGNKTANENSEKSNDYYEEDDRPRKRSFQDKTSFSVLKAEPSTPKPPAPKVDLHANPFAGLTASMSGSPSQQSTSNSPSMFGAQNNNAQNSQSTFFGFGQNQNQTQTQTNQQQSSQPGFSFGGTPAAQSKSSNVFGMNSTAQSQPSQQQSPGSLFKFGAQNQQASSPQSGQSLFSFGTQNNQASQQQSALPQFSFGGQSQQPSEQQVPKPTFSFGGQPQPAPEQQASKAVFNFGAPAQSAAQQQAQAPAFSFGNQGQTSTEQQATKPPFSFLGAAQSAPEQPSAKPVFSFAAPAQSAPEQQQPASKPTFTFGAPAQSAPEQQQPASKPTFTFGAPAQSAKPQPNAAPAVPRSWWGEDTPPPSNSLGAPPSDTVSTAKSEVSSAGSNQPISSSDFNRTPGGTSGMFRGGSRAETHPTQPTPAPPPRRASQEEIESSTLKANPFSMPETVSEPQSNEGRKPSLFGQFPSSQPADASAPTASQPAINWGQPSTGPSASTESTQPASNPFSGLFAKPAAPSVPAAPTFGQAPSSQQGSKPSAASGIFGGPAPSSGGLFTSAPPKPAHQAEPTAAPKAAEKLTAESAPKKSLFGTLSQPASRSITEQSGTSADTLTGPKEPPIQRPVYTKSPGRIPSFLNGEGFKEYDNNYRLRALNKEFKKKIDEWDADRYDIENLLRHYVTARSAIGGDIGLQQRTLAGTKRKNDEYEDLNAVPAKYKKTVTDAADQSSAESPSSPEQTRPVATKPTAPVASKPASPAKATSLFSTMIPEGAKQSGEQAKEAATPAKPVNPFSGVAFIPNSTQPPAFGSNTLHAGATPRRPTSNIFGQPPASTTPAKSPPKTGVFGQSTPLFGTVSKKRKTHSDDDDEVSDDEGRNKRNRLSPPRSPLGIPSTQKKKMNGPFEEDSDDEQEPEDTQDSDFAPNADGSDSDESEDEEDSQQTDDREDNEAQQQESETSRASDEERVEEKTANPNKGKSLFDRISAPAKKPEDNTPPAGQPATSSGIQWKSLTPEAPAFSPITPSSQSPYKPATTFNFTPTPAVKATPTHGASVLSGGLTNGGFAKFDGMFGSRPSTPEPEKSKTNDAPTSNPTIGDHTWKAGSPIKFSSNVVPPSPRPDAAANDKNASADNVDGQNEDASAGSLGFSFGRSPAVPGFLKGNQHLVPESAASSAMSSRATSPGLTDNESVATNDTTEETTHDDPQQNLMDARPGEENEDVLLECRAKALLMAKGDRAKELKVPADEWRSIGVGVFRILQHKTTKKARVVLRAEPGSNVVLNSYLNPEIDYVVRDQGKNSGAVNARFDRGGFLDHIVLKVKDQDLAERVAKVLNDSK